MRGGRRPGLRTPVALLVYNRLDLTLRVIERLWRVRPRQLWVAADAPRHRDAVDGAACRSVLEGIQEHVDWPCRIRVRVAETHLGRGPDCDGARIVGGQRGWAGDPRGGL